MPATACHYQKILKVSREKCNKFLNWSNITRIKIGYHAILKVSIVKRHKMS